MDRQCVCTNPATDCKVASSVPDFLLSGKAFVSCFGKHYGNAHQRETVSLVICSRSLSLSRSLSCLGADINTSCSATSYMVFAKTYIIALTFLGGMWANGCLPQIPHHQQNQEVIQSKSNLDEPMNSTGVTCRSVTAYRCLLHWKRISTPSSYLLIYPGKGWVSCCHGANPTLQKGMLVGSILFWSAVGHNSCSHFKISLACYTQRMDSRDMQLCKSEKKTDSCGLANDQCVPPLLSNCHQC